MPGERLGTWRTTDLHYLDAQLGTSGSETPMLSLLTKRMREILGLLVQGKSEKEVATDLGLSPHTVQIHVTRMYARLGVNSRAELLAAFTISNPVGGRADSGRSLVR